MSPFKRERRDIKMEVNGVTEKPRKGENKNTKVKNGQSNDVGCFKVTDISVNENDFVKENREAVNLNSWKDEKKGPKEDVLQHKNVKKIKVRKPKGDKERKDMASRSEHNLVQELDTGDRKGKKNSTIFNNKEVEGEQNSEKEVVEDEERDVEIRERKRKRKEKQHKSDKVKLGTESFKTELFGKVSDTERKMIATDEYGKNKDHSGRKEEEVMHVTRKKKTKDKDGKDGKPCSEKNIVQVLDTGGKKGKKNNKIINKEGEHNSEKYVVVYEERGAKIREEKKNKKKRHKSDEVDYDTGSPKTEFIDKVYDKETERITTDQEDGKIRDYNNGEGGGVKHAIAKKKAKKEKEGKDSKFGSKKILIKESMNKKKERVGVEEATNVKNPTSLKRKTRERHKKAVDNDMKEEGRERSENHKRDKVAGTEISTSKGEEMRKNNVDVEPPPAEKVNGNDYQCYGKSRKRVSFSDDVEVFLFHDEDYAKEEKELVQGRRFSQDEDEKIKESVMDYIKARGLGDKGLEMVLKCKSHPEVRGCWMDIGAALPWRPYSSVRHRAHVLFERSAKRKWEHEEYNQLTSSMVVQGIWDNTDDYKMIAILLKLDACCVEDVDWDTLLCNRSGEVCLKRWSQMSKHIGEYRDKPFAEQVEVLASRYCPTLLEQDADQEKKTADCTTLLSASQ